jgi:SpoVK/Ycf46/Vps4 family AAA+-type ATPase
LAFDSRQTRGRGRKRFSQEAVQEVSLDNRQTDETVPPYASNWEHISDELRHVDLLIRLQLLQEQHQKPVRPLDQFRGLVLSDEEIAGLLADSQKPRAADAPMNPQHLEQQELVTARSRLEGNMRQRLAARSTNSEDLLLPVLSRLFHLTRFEEQCLIVCLAPELDRKYEKLYAYLQDDVTRRKPSVDLLLSLLCQTPPQRLAARAVFDPQAPLLRYRLIQTAANSPDNPAPLLQRFLKLDDRIVNFLLGFRQIDARLEHVAQLLAPEPEARPVPATEEIREQMRGFLQTHFSEQRSLARNVMFYLQGPYGSGKRALATSVSHDLGLPLLVGDVEQILSGSLAFADTIWLLCREAVLQPAVLCLENMDSLLAEPDKHRGQLQSLMEALRTFARVAFLLGSHSWQPQGILREEAFIALEMPRTDATARKRLWESHSNIQHRLAADVDWGLLACNFRLQPGQMREAMITAENLARWRSPTEGCITMADLYAACRAQSNSRLGTLARKIEPRYTWDDIVLPPDHLTQLKELCNQARYRHIVYGDWGFERKLSLGKGLNALFSGPPGTGKTMAAEVIAHELNLDLYQIDLSQVVSKYIGETEKNLHQIFREAQTGHAILFFDEADALFGKRSEVKDAHDRYANIEISYLLQKMEEYEGVAILATNLRENLDEAFVRRMHFIVEFPFPDEEYRRRIWKVVFPREAPLGEDVNFGLLAREIKLAGGNIKNMGLAAAFYAASDGAVIGMSHLIRAARREHQKLGRTWDKPELRDKSSLLS